MERVELAAAGDKEGALVRLSSSLLAALALIQIGSCAPVSVAPVAELPPYTAANWCSEAEAYLTRNDAPVRCQQMSSAQIAQVALCVRANNYWCVKQNPRDPWRGTPTAAGTDGAQDPRGHAIFSSSDWGARAAATVLRTYHRRGSRSALAIAAEYSPWCDTQGSGAVVQGHGRTCADGEHPPADFSGPLCETPTAPRPTEADCKPGCNCPIGVAETLVSGTGLTIYDDLELFNDALEPSPRLTLVLRNLARRETGGYIVSDTRIQDGIDLMSPPQ